MKIALHDAERDHIKNKTFPNFALMKISQYYKQKGDKVVWFNALERDFYDLVYSSKVFDFTENSLWFLENTIKGGIGYGNFEDLPQEIDRCFPDYSIYPDCDYAIGFITRGCINNCSFCIVPKKEGNIRPYRKWQDIIRTDTYKLTLMDNNILSCEYGIGQLEELSYTNYKVDLNQGMDITLVDDRICEILKRLKWQRFIRFSCDKDYQVEHFKRVNELFKKHGISTSRVFIYLLVQKDVNNAEERLRALEKINENFNIYAQAERNELLEIRPNKEQLEFAQRYVYGRSYKKETWGEHKKRISFRKKKKL